MTGKAPRSNPSPAVAAFVFLQLVSTFNSLKQRVQRLRQPKYLFGAIVGGAYVYFFFFRRLLQANTGRHSVAIAGLAPEMASHFAALAGLALFVVVVYAWLVPSDRATVKFSEAEVAFLFAAPLTRRTLIQFSLLRSQIRIFVSAFLMSLLFRRGGGSGWQHATGIWLILSMLSLHYLGASFARERLLALGVHPRSRRMAIGGLLIAIGLGCWWRLRAQVSLPTTDDLADAKAVWKYVDSVLGAAPLSWVLIPFKVVVGPYFATDSMEFLRALVPAALLLVAHYVWVLRSQVSFEEASIDFARRRAERVAAMREGKRGLRNAPAKPRSAPFRLAPMGMAPIAFLWKGLIAMGPFWRLRTWLIACAIVIVGGQWLASDPDRRGLLVILGYVASECGVFLLLLGPMIMQRGLRRTIDYLDILKASPLRGWQIAIGELLCPLVVMTFILWLLLVMTEVSLAAQPNLDAMAVARINIGLVGMALAAPTLCGLMLCVPFAGLLYFPAWTAAVGSRGGGLEVAGQRMIFMGGYMVTFVVSVIPAAAIGGLAFLIARWLVDVPVAVLVAALFASATLVAELAGAVDWLGRRIDGFDVSQEFR